MEENKIATTEPLTKKEKKQSVLEIYADSYLLL